MQTAKVEGDAIETAKTLMSLKGVSIAATTAVVLTSGAALTFSNELADSDQIVKGVLSLVDNGDRMPLGAELFGYRAANSAAANDNNIHNLPRVICRMEVNPRRQLNHMMI